MPFKKMGLDRALGVCYNIAKIIFRVAIYFVGA